MVDDRIYADMPRSDEVASQRALVCAASDQRRAMELDRAGNYRESRKLLHQAFDHLMDAPDTDEVLQRRTEAERRENGAVNC